MTDKNRLRRLFKNLLKEEDHISHNCNDQRMIDWACKTVEIEWFHYDYIYFGCSCDGEYHNENFDSGQNYEINPDNELWEEWMNDISEEKICIYRCSECGEWAIDGDF